MQLIKIKILVVVLVLSLSFASMVYSDTANGWKGYGLYNINDSKITIINEDVNIELLNDRLAYNGEFLIRNISNTVVKATLGMPVQGIDQFKLLEKTSAIKWRKRSAISLQNEFGMENRIPKEAYWYVFNITLNPGETKLLNVSLEAAQMKDEQNNYIFSYYNDRKLGFSNQMEKTSLYIGMSDFQPYNILSVQGFDPGLMGIKGDVVLKKADDNMDAVSIKYMDVTKALLDKLKASTMYKLKEITLAFTGKNYSKASSLCDEYLLNPIDSEISNEEILFIKAESMRRLQNYEKYLSIVETMNYSKLYPIELKNKIRMDRLTIYFEHQSNDKLTSLYNEIEQDTSESTQILKAWIKNSSIYGASQLSKEPQIKQIKNEEPTNLQNNSKLGLWYDKAMDYKYTSIIIFALGVLLGLTIRMIRFKRKRRKSNYIYRR